MDIRKLPNKEMSPEDRKAAFDSFRTAKKSQNTVSTPVEPLPQTPLRPEPTPPSLKQDLTTIAVLDLPSKMLPYPARSSIKFTPFTFGDIQNFNSSTLSDEDRIRFLLDGIYTTGFPRDNLTYQDFLFIAVLRKLSAFHQSKFTARFACDECGTANEQVADISEINFKDLEIPALPLVIDLEDGTGRELHLKPISIGAHLKLRNVETDRYLLAFANSVVNMPPEQALEILQKANGELIDVLEMADEMLGFGEQSLERRCTNCNHMNEFSLGDISNLIAPFHREKDAVKSRIRFG